MSRIDLTEDRTVTIGVDYPDCVTCYNDFFENYDLRGKNVTVIVPKTIYGFSLSGKLTGQRSPRSFTFAGANDTAWNAPSPIAIQSSSSVLVEADDDAQFALANFQLRNPNGFGAVVSKGAIAVRDCWFGGFANAALDVCGSQSHISASGFSTILFEDTGAFAISEGGNIFIGSNLYISGAPNFRNAFVQADLGGYIDLTGYKLLEPGAATGRKFAAYSGGNIENNGYVLPGNLPGDINGGYYQ